MDNQIRRAVSQPEAVLSFLRNQGVLPEDGTLTEETIRQAQEKKQKQAKKTRTGRIPQHP